MLLAYFFCEFYLLSFVFTPTGIPSLLSSMKLIQTSIDIAYQRVKHADLFNSKLNQLFATLRWLSDPVICGIFNAIAISWLLYSQPGAHRSTQGNTWSNTGLDTVLPVCMKGFKFPQIWMLKFPVLDNISPFQKVLLISLSYS